MSMIKKSRRASTQRRETKEINFALDAKLIARSMRAVGLKVLPCVNSIPFPQDRIAVV